MMTSRKVQKPTSNSKEYWKHIVLILVVKGVLLSMLWWAFFRTPIVLDDKSAGEHIFYNKR